MNPDAVQAELGLPDVTKYELASNGRERTIFRYFEEGITVGFEAVETYTPRTPEVIWAVQTRGPVYGDLAVGMQQSKFERVFGRAQPSESPGVMSIVGTNEAGNRLEALFKSGKLTAVLKSNPGFYPDIWFATMDALPSYDIADIRLDMSSSDVLAALGQPDQSRRTPGGVEIWSYTQEGLTVGMKGGTDSSVAWILQTEGTGQLGLAIGVPQEQAIRVFSASGYPLTGDSHYIRLADSKGNAYSILMDDGKISAFSLTQGFTDAKPPEAALAGIHLMMSPAQVAEILGNPAEVEQPELGMAGVVWAYPRLGVRILLAPWITEAKQVVRVEQYCGAHSSGLAVGDPQPEAERRFGGVGQLRLEDGARFEIIVEKGRVSKLVLVTSPD